MTQKEKKEIPCSAPLTSCCPKKGDIENVSLASVSVTGEQDSIAYTDRSSLLINASSIFQGPNVQVDLEFKDLSYEVKIKKNETKKILKNVNGTFKKGEMTAVLGPSGAGKSSLLNILAGYNVSGTISGKVLVNGNERNMRRFRKISCYIMQDDILMPNLTVFESMMVSANLHLKSVLTIDEKHRVIEDILSCLGLINVRNTYMSEISGGQRKRLAIALELVNNPPVIFLDEPTSGLDSMSAYQCISLMKSLAEGGRTVICTIHQPSAKLFEMFHKLYLLTSGQCMYHGELKTLVPYFETQNLVCPKYHNPADFVIEVASGEYGDRTQDLVKSWRIQEKRDELKRMEMGDFGEGEDVDALLSQQMMVSMMPGCGFKSSTDSLASSTSQTTQFAVLSKRAMVSIIRDKMFTQLRFISVVLVALLIGLLYLGVGNDGNKVQSNTGCLFFSLLFLLFIALMPTVLTFPLEKLVFIREHLNNWYSLKSYYLAITMADLPFQIILPVIYCSIVYYMTSQPNDGTRYTQYVAITVLTCLVAQSIGLLLGAVAPNVPTAVFVAPVTGIPVLLFSGFFVSFDTIPKYMRWLTYISFARYSWEGILVAIYGNNRGALDCGDDVSRCRFQQSGDVLAAMDIEESALHIDQGKFYFDCVVLGMFFVTLRLITYMVLRYKIKTSAER